VEGDGIKRKGLGDFSLRVKTFLARENSGKRDPLRARYLPVLDHFFSFALPDEPSAAMHRADAPLLRAASVD
jgi:hypothetical protein